MSRFLNYSISIFLGFISSIASVDAVSHSFYRLQKESSLHPREYFYEQDEALVKTLVLETEEQEPLACWHFTYDDSNQIQKTTLSGNLSELCQVPLHLDCTHVPVENGIEHYSTYWEYEFQENGSILVIKQREDNGKVKHLYYDTETNNLIAQLEGDQNRFYRRRFFEYENGLITRFILDDGSNSDKMNLENVTERHVFCYSYTPCLSYVQQIEESYLDLTQNDLKVLNRVVYIFDSNGVAQTKQFFDRTDKLVSTQKVEKGLEAFQLGNQLLFDNVSKDELAHYPKEAFGGSCEYYLDGALKKSYAEDKSCTHYEHDVLGRITALKVYDQNGKCLSAANYLYAGFHLREYFNEFDGIHLSYLYDDAGHLKEIVNYAEHNWTNASSSSWTSYFDRLVDYLNAFKAAFSYESYIQKDFDELANNVVGSSLLTFAGYNPEESGAGFFQGKQSYDNVHITLINGILNSTADINEALQMFSSSHGDASIHYVFRASQGWSKDVMNCFLIKLGYASPQAGMLAHIWKTLLKEMNARGRSGVIIHYAHSIGALDTYMAKHMLTPEERRQIHIITLGSPTMLEEEDFASVMNYGSLRDPICMVDPMGYVRGLLGNGNVELTGSIWGIPEHTLKAQSYCETIQMLGRHFMQAYGAGKKTNN